jgi:hypothetical protein
VQRVALERGVAIDPPSAPDVDRRVDAAAVVGLDGDGGTIGSGSIHELGQGDDALVADGTLMVTREGMRQVGLLVPQLGCPRR